MLSGLYRIKLSLTFYSNPHRVNPVKEPQKKKKVKANNDHAFILVLCHFIKKFGINISFRYSKIAANGKWYGIVVKILNTYK